MTKSKLFPSFIAKASARKAAYKQRKQGLIKKMRELSILCDVPAVLIIYCHGLGQPEIWSSTPDPLQLLRQFMSLPETERSKKMLNQEEFLEREIKKLEDQLQKIERENNELEMTLLLCKLLSGEVNLDDISPETAIKLSAMVGKKLAQVRERISAIKAEKLLNDSPDEDTNLPSFGGAAPDTAKLDRALHALGFEYDFLSPEKVTGKLKVTETCCQPFNVLSGGVSALLAEAMASLGAYIASGYKRVAGVQLAINHFRPTLLGELVEAEARPIQLGRSIQVWQVEIWKINPSTPEKKTLVSSSRVTLLCSQQATNDTKAYEQMVKTCAKL